MWFEWAFVLISTVFCGFMVWFHYHFSRVESLQLVPTNNELSILITFKNEPEAIIHLIQRLGASQIKGGEIILANDHSDAESIARIDQLISRFDFRLINAPQGTHGKKLVQRWAMDSVNTPFCLVLDADTIPPIFIFEGFMPAETGAVKMVVFPIQPARRKGFWNGFFDLDFLSLQFATVASANAGNPLLSNGACLLIDTAAYREVASTRTDWNYAHGDDVFLLHAVAQRFGSRNIKAVQAKQGAAIAEFPTGFRKLFLQRLRWMSKVGRLHQPFFQFVIWTIFSAQFTLAIGVAVSVLDFAMSALVFLPYVFIAASCGCLLLRASISFKRSDLLPYILPSLVLYPFYLLSLSAISLFYKPKWKV